MDNMRHTNLIADKEIGKVNAVEGNRDDAHGVQKHVPFSFEVLGFIVMRRHSCPGTGHANMQKWIRRTGVMIQ